VTSLWAGLRSEGAARSLDRGAVQRKTRGGSVRAAQRVTWVTIYANAGHAYIEVAGIYLDTAAGLGNPPNPPPSGPRWSTVGTGPTGFIARHPPGL
jgi:hypothetical protein